MKKTTLFTLLALLTLPTMAQKKLFTLNDLIPGGSTYYASSVPANKDLTWWGDECIELDTDECRLISKTDGSHTTLLTLSQLNTILTAAGHKPIHHFYYATFPYAQQPLIRIDNGSEQTLLNWKEGTITWHITLPSQAANTDWNPTSRAMAYTISHNLHILTPDGSHHTLSTDGNALLTYGESVHRDEFGISKGTFWSPDGTLLAFYKMDQSMVSKYPQLNIGDGQQTTDNGQQTTDNGQRTMETPSRCATIEPDPYPMAGETSHKVYIGIYNTHTRKTIYLNTGDPTDRYFTNIAWAPDGTKLYLIELNRDQNHGSLDEYDATTGNKLRTLFTESNSKYFEPSHPIQFLPWDSTQFIYQTRKDGYNHIYLYNVAGECLRQLTTGTYEVLSVLGFNQAQKTILYTSNEAHPLSRNLYKVSLKGKRTPLSLTPADQGETGLGWHTPTLSPTGSYAIDSHSSPHIARNIDIISTKNGQTRNIFSAPNPWDAFQVPEIKTGSIKAADGTTDLYYRLILPTNFDPNKKYPAIVYVYGGPHAHNIDASRNWGARGWDIWMAQKGYVMFCLDNRGSEHRGLAFEQATFRQLGVEEMKDQICGVDYLKSLPYVDSTRLGVHGWSFGGFMTTSLMTTYPEVFKVGVAGGPVIDWRFYEVMYGERYMDTPQSNPEGYRSTSLLNKAKNLKGRLLVIHGGNDPVCVPQHTLSFMRACIDANTYPDLFIYPGDGHNMAGTDRIHLHHVITRYFEDHLK